MVYCKKCGKYNSKGAYCKNCGAKLPKKEYFKFIMIIILVLLIISISALLFIPKREKIITSENKTEVINPNLEKNITQNNTYFPEENISIRKYCGDGICEDYEIGNCYKDCQWCGDGFCEQNENCSLCDKDCGNCSGLYCGDSICGEGECAIQCTKDCRLSECIDGVCDSRMGENCLTSPSDCACNPGEMCDNGKCSGGYCGNSICESSENCSCYDCVCSSLEKCINGLCKTYCGNLVCESNENKANCSLDCGNEDYIENNNPNIDYPIIFVHGHSTFSEDVPMYSVTSFSDMQKKLENDGLYKNMGIILPNSNINDYSFGEWSRYGKPISARTTYYIGLLDTSGNFVKTEGSRSIHEYGARLSKVIDIVLHHTGKNKVILLTHSMGGLVARDYIKNYNGTEKVDKLIQIAAPNNGFYPEDMYGYYITRYFGCDSAHPGQECTDMEAGSSFLKALNSGNLTFGNIKYYTIAGNCCSASGKRNDEVIRVESVNLTGAVNVVFNLSEVSGLDTLHYNLIIPSKNPVVYDKVKEFLSA